MARPSASQEILIEEWKEARRSIGRFDEYLLNLRRYGFTLATILIRSRCLYLDNKRCTPVGTSRCRRSCDDINICSVLA